ncbi:WXG100 family type VII secretion target [Gordonia sp. CPCC 206044]|uniref:WXG100 family type VII secretion target n=1 Tax=Gordonia sp. CPCC 206044 TaxID=3140793 RepID=UPI003AF406E9
MDFTADIERLRVASNEVAQVHGDAVDKWATISKRAEELFGGTWTGAAADSYAEPWSECCDGFEKVLESLEMMGRLLVEVGESYAVRESATVASIEGVVPDGGLNLS